MDLRPTDEQEQLVASFAELFGRRSTTSQVRQAEPRGHDAALWTALRDVGVIEMALAVDDGGWGASLVDLALVAELAGRALAPAPIVEAQVASRLLGRVGHPAATVALATCLDDGAVPTVSLHPRQADVVPLVPAGAVARFVLVLDGDRLLLVDTEGAQVAPVANLGSQPLADITPGHGAVEVAAGPTAVAAHATAVDEWLTLTAAALVGLAARAHELAAEYACQRHAFGQPIGAFQAVAHPLADQATALDGARLLARKAAWTHDADGQRFAELAAMAFAFASETARDATYHALHTHGGYGFMLEQDIQLHYRRARGWARVFGGPALAYRRVASARYASEVA